jgi:hypothetical protein
MRYELTANFSSNKNSTGPRTALGRAQTCRIEPPRCLLSPNSQMEAHERFLMPTLDIGGRS